MIDLKRISELNEIRYDAAHGLTLGAAVLCYRIYREPAVARVYPKSPPSSAASRFKAALRSAATCAMPRRS